MADQSDSTTQIVGSGGSQYTGNQSEHTRLTVANCATLGVNKAIDVVLVVDKQIQSMMQG